jgi:hypothetical protein
VEETDDGIPLSGNLPLSRHKAILDKARQRYEEQVERLKWAERYTPRDVEVAFTIAEQIDKDPYAVWERLERELRADARYADKFQPAAAPAAKPANAAPEPDVLLDNGTLVYSDKQAKQLAEWMKTNAVEEIRREIEPITREHASTKAWKDALTRSGGKIEAARASWPEFGAVEGDIKALIARELQAGRVVTLEDAYRQVLVPKLIQRVEDTKASERQKVLAELKQKASVQSVERPEAPKPATTTTPRRYATTVDVVADVVRELSGR